MNIFMLDEDPKICADYHCLKHQLKMIIEYAQLMSTAHRVLDGEHYIEPVGRKIKRWRLAPIQDDILYKATHVNHPSNQWVRLSKDNYIWIFNMWRELCKNYNRDYGKIHATYSKLIYALAQAPKNIPDIGFVPMSDEYQAMPIELKKGNPVDSYRNFYNIEKASFAKWKINKPEWFTG